MKRVYLQKFTDILSSLDISVKSWPLKCGDSTLGAIESSIVSLHNNSSKSAATSNSATLREVLDKVAKLVRVVVEEETTTVSCEIQQSLLQLLIKIGGNCEFTDQ